MDIDPEEGVMLRSDFIYYADTLDCFVFFFSFPHPKALYDMI